MGKIKEVIQDTALKYITLLSIIIVIGLIINHFYGDELRKKKVKPPSRIEVGIIPKETESFQKIYFVKDKSCLPLLNQFRIGNDNIDKNIGLCNIDSLELKDKIQKVVILERDSTRKFVKVIAHQLLYSDHLDAFWMHNSKLSKGIN